MSANHTTFDVHPGALTYWSANATSTIKPYNSRFLTWQPPNPQARPIDILTTSYALLAYTSSGRHQEGIPSLHWLTKQRNSRGGFTSTQVLSAFCNEQ